MTASGDFVSTHMYLRLQIPWIMFERTGGQLRPTLVPPGEYRVEHRSDPAADHPEEWMMITGTNVGIKRSLVAEFAASGFGNFQIQVHPSSPEIKSRP